MILHKKSGAIELSMTTMIVIVLSVILLILGFVFVRSIMCSAIGITSEIGNKAEAEVQRLFDTSTGEISCIGSDHTIPMGPGGNVISCGIKAKSQGNYVVKFVEITSNSRELDSIDLDSWVRDNSKNTINPRSPGDETSVKTIRLDIPENSPEGEFYLTISAQGPDGAELSGVKQLDFKVTRSGIVKNIIC